MRFIIAVLICVFSVSSWAAEPTTASTHLAPIKKPKLLRSNPHRFAAIKFAGSEPCDTVEDEDIITTYRYRFKLESNSEELSEQVRFRLWLARHLALKRFVQTHGRTV
jgi:hypothetical protein